MTTFSTRGQDGPASRLLIHADDPGQANRLALLVSHYGHQPGILDTRQLLTPTQRGDALLVSCRQFSAEVRLGLSLWPDMPRLLFCERLGGDTQLALLQQGVLLVPHPCGEREPVEQWLRLARSQLAMVQALMQTESELRQLTQAQVTAHGGAAHQAIGLVLVQPLMAHQASLGLLDEPPILQLLA
jgi:response regulator NasT